MKDSEADITIVIVEDQEIKRLALRRSLGCVRGFRITGEAGDSATALHQAMNLKPKVIMIDAGLPSFSDGLEAVKQLKNRMPEAKVMMMSTQGSGIDILAAIGAGADSFCQKRLNSSQLEIAVKTVASGGAWLDQTVAAKVLHAAATGQAASGGPKHNLSDRQQEVLTLVADGKSNNDIAAQLGISVETVKTHIRHLTEKLGVHSRTEAAVKAIQEQLTG